MFNKLKTMFKPLTLHEALQVVKEQYSPQSSTRNWYDHPIGLLIDIVGEDTPINAITEDNLIDWQTHVEKSPNSRTGGKRSLHTQDSYKRAMRAFWNKLIKMGHIRPPGPHSVINFIHLPENEPKQLSDEEVDALLAVSRRDIRNHAMMQVLRASGIRIGGLVSMRMSAINIYELEPEISREERELLELALGAKLDYMLLPKYLRQLETEFNVITKGKSGRKKSRAAFLDHEASEALQAYIETRPLAAPDKLWLTNKGKPITRAGMYQAFHGIARAANVDASPHDLRHTFAFRLIENGVNPKMAAKMLGHSDFKTTLGTYYNPRKKDIRNTYRNVIGKNRHLHRDE